VLSVAPLGTPDGLREIGIHRLASLPAVSLFLARAGDVVPVGFHNAAPAADQRRLMIAIGWA